MDEAHRELVRHWLTKAQHDLASARKLAAEPDAYLDTAVFHLQQAAEKTVKGFLVFHDQPFEKTHDMDELVRLATRFETRLDSWLEPADRLTPYATDFRYPMMREPPRDEFEQALRTTEGLMQFVLSLLPPEVRPHG